MNNQIEQINMRNKLFLIGLLILIQATCFSQARLSKDFLTTVGSPYKVVDAKSKDYFTDGKGFTVSIKTEGERVTIQRFDIASMREVSRKEYEDFPLGNKIQNVFKFGDRLHYVFSSFNKKEAKEQVYAREINMTDGTFQPVKLLFSTASEVAVSSYGEFAGTSAMPTGTPVRFEVFKSFDDSKLLIRYRLVPAERNDSKNFDVIGFYVFNANLEKQWGGEVKMPYTEKDMNNLAYGVTKDGSAYMVAYINGARRMEIFKISDDIKLNAKVLNINSELLFQELKLREAADGTLLCIGFYANGVDYKFSSVGFGVGSLSYNTNGILAFKINKNGEVTEKFDFEFPIDLINQYESKRETGKNEKRESKGKAGIRDLKLIDVTLNKDGSTTIIGEQQYIVSKMSRAVAGAPSQSKEYFYCDVIATKFDKGGKLTWMKKLPKTQEGSAGKGGLSIKYIKGTTANYILYLDNVNNIDIALDEVPKKHYDRMGGFLTAYKVDDNTGAIEKHSIFDITDIKGTSAYQFRTSRIFDITDKIFMLEVYLKGKEDTMIKLELAK
jgi:hypothetical protein